MSVHLTLVAPTSGSDDMAVPPDGIDGPTAADRATVRRIALLVGVVLALLVLRSWVVTPMRVRSDSMAPTLRPGDLILLDKVSLRTRTPFLNEIVVATDPLTGQTIVKRVVAVGGDEVGIEDGRLVRNGVVVAELDVDLAEMNGYYFGPVAVPEGHVFLLGDRRAESVDSRRFGPVPLDALEGRVLTLPWG